MSIAAANPFVDRWTKQGLEWTYLAEQKVARRIIKAHSSTQLPIDKFIFKYPEGVLIQLTALFDHPKLGVRLEQNPDHDTSFVPEQMALGVTRPEPLVYAMMPPFTPGIPPRRQRPPASMNSQSCILADILNVLIPAQRKSLMRRL